MAEPSSCTRSLPTKQGQRAIESLHGGQASSAQASPSSMVTALGDEATLRVISCSRRKAWDDPNVRDRYLPGPDCVPGVPKSSLGFATQHLIPQGGSFSARSTALLNQTIQSRTTT